MQCTPKCSLRASARPFALFKLTALPPVPMAGKLYVQSSCQHLSSLSLTRLPRPNLRAFKSAGMLTTGKSELPISFWKAAAIVLNDLASSAYYAGGEAEGYIGKTAPWFILGIMIFSYAVRAVYVESCSMFVRGGVYRAVKQSLGGGLAKFSVSALMFDYILTGPISGVSAGQYLSGLLDELFLYFHFSKTHFSEGTTGLIAATFAIIVTAYFWWENTKGIPESSEKALHIMKLVTVMVVILITWCLYTLSVRPWHLPPLPHPRNLHLTASALGWLKGIEFSKATGLLGMAAVFIGLGHSVL